MHIVQSAYFPFVLKVVERVVTSLAPVAPRGVLWRWHRHSDSREARRLEFPIRAAQPVPVTRNASFNSTTSICPSDNPAFARTFRVAGTGPCPLFGERRQPPPKQRLGLLASIRGVSVLSLRPRVMHKLVIHTRRISAVIVPSGLTTGFQFRKRFQRRVRPGMFIFGEM